MEADGWLREALFAYRVAPCTCHINVTEFTTHHQSCEKFKARGLMQRNVTMPHRLEEPCGSTSGEGWRVEDWRVMTSYQTASAAHAGYADIIGSPKLMKMYRHVRLYMSGRLAAEKKSR